MTPTAASPVTAPPVNEVAQAAAKEAVDVPGNSAVARLAEAATPPTQTTAAAQNTATPIAIQTAFLRLSLASFSILAISAMSFCSSRQRERM